MRLPSTIFRQYDIRGLVDKELTPAAARAVGQAYTTLAWERLGKAPRVAVGRYNRPSGARLAQGVCEGIAAAGGAALDVGELPTPALYFATKTLPVDGGIQVTGSRVSWRWRRCASWGWRSSHCLPSPTGRFRTITPIPRSSKTCTTSRPR